MIYVDGNVVNLTRGDDAVLTVPLKNTDKTEYVLGEQEYLIFGLKKYPTDESELLLEIHSSLGSNEIRFRHDDTKDLLVGDYSAEVQLMTRDGQRVTVWPKLTGSARTSKQSRKNFYLMSEVVLA